MAFVSKISNFFLNTIGITEPTGVWEKIIMGFHGGIPNYAWAIIIFTIVLKVVMLPLDFFNKKITAKNTKLQSVVQPEIEKIQKKYGNNKQMINQKTMEIYKKYNYNVTGSCVIMIVNMALTLFIFFTLFAGLNSMAAYKVGYQYEQMEKTYNQYAYGITVDTEGNELDEETDYEKYINAYNVEKETIKNTAESAAKQTIINNHAADETPYSDDNFDTIATAEEKAIVIQAGADAIAEENNITLMQVAGETASGKDIETISNTINENVIETHNNVKDSWLWIDNVWKSDVPWKKSATNFDEFLSLTKITYVNELSEGQQETFYVRLAGENNVNKEADKEKYDAVMSAIESENRVNGYLIIPILAIGLSLLSMLATQGKLKFKKKKKDELLVEKTEGQAPVKKPKSGLIMMILIPALMGYISISYNAVFGLYILMSSLVGVASTPLINILIKKLDERAEKKKNDKVEVSYKR